jgi:trans-2,3-dihydro-3-hydroxyanthranilate isomerase
VTVSQPADAPSDADVAAGVEFAYVDVFASAPLTGAPLTLVPDADGITDHQMRAIAREFNQSETTFILSSSLPGATRRLRSFTPTGEEVFGAGHNALGAWLWLASSGQLAFHGDDTTFTQHIGADVLPVHMSRPDGRRVVVTMDQSPPQFGAVVTDRAGLAGALGLQEDDLVDGRPAQVVSTGAGHLLVPIRDRAAVDRAAPDAARLTAALRQVGGEGCYLYTDDTVGGDATAYARFFNPAMGIGEDPATGTAAGPLAALLVADGTVAPAAAGEATVVIEQGHSMGRPSTIMVTVSGTRVRVSGSGLVVARGTMTLPAAS